MRTAVRRARRRSWPRSPARSRAACRVRSAVARLRSIGAGRARAGPAGAARACRQRVGPGRVVPRRDADLVAVRKRRGQVQLAAGPVGIDARSVATRRRDQSPTRESGGQPEDAGSFDRPDDLDDEDRRGRRRRRCAPLETRPARGLPNGDATVDGHRPADPVPEREHERPRRPAAPRRADSRRPAAGRRATALGAVPAAVRSDAAARRVLQDAPRRRDSDPRIDLPGGMVGERRRGTTRRLATLGALPTRRDVIDSSDGRLSATYQDRWLIGRRVDARS